MAAGAVYMVDGSAVLANPCGEPRSDAQADEIRWLPSDDAIDSWLEWYKVWVKKEFPDIRTLFPMTATGMMFGEVVLEPTVEAADQMIATLEAFEHALYTLEATRFNVGAHQGLGYETGRQGGVRLARNYKGPCNEGYAWYNGWRVGHADYLRAQTRSAAGGARLHP